MELSSIDYKELFHRVANEDSLIKESVEKYKASDRLDKNPKLRQSREPELTESEIQTKNSMEEILLSKYGKSSVQLICEVSSVREPPPPRYPCQYPMKLCS